MDKIKYFNVKIINIFFISKKKALSITLLIYKILLFTRRRLQLFHSKFFHFTFFFLCYVLLYFSLFNYLHCVLFSFEIPFLSFYDKVYDFLGPEYLLFLLFLPFLTSFSNFPQLHSIPDYLLSILKTFFKCTFNKEQ